MITKKKEKQSAFEVEFIAYVKQMALLGPEGRLATDALQFWGTNSVYYPIKARLTRQTLAVGPTECSCEAIFFPSLDAS